jgi:hypothetical protein
MSGLWYIEADKTLTVAKAGSGTGVVTSTPGGIDCGTDCIETYGGGTLVTLTAIADADSIFGGWSGGGCSGTGTCEVTMNADVTVTATLLGPLSVNEGTIGTQMTIAGPDFGTKKGKVLIGGLTTKIISWTDSSITCEIKKPLPPRSYDVVIKLKEPKGAPALNAGVFNMMAPEITSVLPNSGAEGAVIVLSGNYFGSKKGKVYLEDPVSGKKNCKVTSWGMDSITFVVPKGLDSSSTYPLKIINKVGIAGAPSVFTID